MVDSLGFIGNLITEKVPELGPITVPVIMICGGFLFRVVQKMLQKLPTKWKWVNNKLTVSIISKIISGLFGKTTLFYNAIPEDIKTKEELKKEAAKYLSRNGGILQEFEKIIKQQGEQCSHTDG
jgi:hypothetical protein